MAKILVVDDDEDVRILVRMALEKASYEVMEADNVEAGIQILRTAAVDLILTDIVMPKKSGLEFIKEIQSNFTGVKIVAISGGFNRSSDKDGVLAKAIEIESAIAKPFTTEELLETVSKALAPNQEPPK